MATRRVRAYPALPEVQPGDEISVFAEGRQPLVYKDARALVRREFLARQVIDLLATLRTSKLLEKTGEAKPSLWLGPARSEAARAAVLMRCSCRGQRLPRFCTRVLRTDRDGAVQILTDRHAIRVSCYRGVYRGSGGRISKRGGAKLRQEPTIGAEIPASPDVHDFCGIAAN